MIIIVIDHYIPQELDAERSIVTENPAAQTRTPDLVLTPEVTLTIDSTTTPRFDPSSTPDQPQKLRTRSSVEKQLPQLSPGQ